MLKVIKTAEEWKKLLSPESYRITREAGTERPFTGEYYATTAKGEYHCICCDSVLFESDTKFDAGCVWPSFWAARMAVWGSAVSPSPLLSVGAAL